LYKNRTNSGVDKLRNEGEKEEGGFRVQNFRHNALQKGIAAATFIAVSLLLEASGPDHASPEKNQVQGTSPANGSVGDGGGCQNGRDSQSRSEDVRESTDEGTEGRQYAFAPASSEASG